MGTHEKPITCTSHRKGKFNRILHDWCRRHDKHIKVCLSVIAQFAMGGAVILAFDPGVRHDYFAAHLAVVVGISRIRVEKAIGYLRGENESPAQYARFARVFDIWAPWTLFGVWAVVIGILLLAQ